AELGDTCTALLLLQLTPTSGHGSATTRFWFWSTVPERLAIRAAATFEALAILEASRPSLPDTSPIAHVFARALPCIGSIDTGPRALLRRADRARQICIVDREHLATVFATARWPREWSPGM